MIKFEHSVFALPFALTGALLAWRDCGFQVAGLRWRFLWILVAMVSARSAAMAFNRLLDSDIDARNRRTASRHLPAGITFRAICLGLHAQWLADVFVGIAGVRLFVFRIGAGGAGDAVFLFVCQAIHDVRAFTAGLLPGHGSGGGVDCHSRDAWIGESAG